MELVKITDLKDLQTFSADVKRFIHDNKMWMDIHGKGYVFVDGWSFMGGMLGITPVIKDLENQSTEDVIKYRASVVLKKGNEVVATGFAICTNKEKGKTQFDEYAVASMAQTRAIGKAYRVYLGWMMRLAGFETTPAEEMNSVDTTVSPEKLKKIVQEYKDGNDS